MQLSIRNLKIKLNETVAEERDFALSFEPSQHICDAQRRMLSIEYANVQRSSNVLIDENLVTWTFPLATHQQQTIARNGMSLVGDEAIIQCSLIAQQTVANNNAPIQRIVGYALKPISVLQAIASTGSDRYNHGYMRHTTAIVDMCGFQELASSNGIEAGFDANPRGILGKALSKDYLYNDFTELLESANVDVNHMPWYIRAVVTMDLAIHMPATVRIHRAGDKRTDMLGFHRLDNEKDFEELQASMDNYIRRATKAHIASAGGLTPYVPHWQPFIVPQYQSHTGLRMPAAAATGTSFWSAGCGPCEEHFVRLLELELQCQNMTVSTFTKLSSRVVNVYMERRHDQFLTKPPNDGSGGSTLTPAEIDVIALTIRALLTNFTTSFAYTTDVSYKQSRGTYTKLELERLTVDLAEMRGFDCEDGTVNHAAVHHYLVTNQTAWKSQALVAATKLLDLFVVVMAKMQCGSNPAVVQPKDDGLICHILSWLVLRDELARWMIRGQSQHKTSGIGQPSVPHNGKSEEFVAAIHAAYWPPELYAPLVPTDSARPHVLELPELWQDNATTTVFYPFHPIYCAEPTAPVAPDQIFIDQLYPDATNQVLGAMAAKRSAVTNVANASKTLLPTLGTWPAATSWPDADVDSHYGCMAQHCTSDQISVFYRGIISLWVTDPVVLLHKQRTLRALASGEARPLPHRSAAIDYMIVDTNHPGKYGVPHGRFIAQNGRGVQSGCNLACVPQTAMSAQELDACTLVALCNKARSNFGHVGEAMDTASEQERALPRINFQHKSSAMHQLIEQQIGNALVQSQLGMPSKDGASRKRYAANCVHVLRPQATNLAALLRRRHTGQLSDSVLGTAASAMASSVVPHRATLTAVDYVVTVSTGRHMHTKMVYSALAQQSNDVISVEALERAVLGKIGSSADSTASLFDDMSDASLAHIIHSAASQSHIVPSDNAVRAVTHRIQEECLRNNPVETHAVVLRFKLHL